MRVYADRRGRLFFGDKVPRDCLTLAHHDDRDHLRRVVRSLGRLAYDGRTLVVPGAPEAKEGQVSSILLHFGEKVRAAL
jgi:hypothetical protein